MLMHSRPHYRLIKQSCRVMYDGPCIFKRLESSVKGQGLSENDKNLSEDENVTIIESKRNKSGLREHHLHMHHKKVPELSEDELETTPLWKYRKRFGRYGFQASIDTKALFPSVSEMEVMKERENFEYPHTVQEMIKISKETMLKEEIAIRERQLEIKEKLNSLENWKRRINLRVQKEEEAARKALELKQKQVEEVREVLGYQISPYDPKFKEILDKKLEEDRIKAKKEKKLRKKQMELDRLMKMAEEEAAQAASEEVTTDPLYGKKIE